MTRVSGSTRIGTIALVALVILDGVANGWGSFVMGAFILVMGMTAGWSIRDDDTDVQ